MLKPFNNRHFTPLLYLILTVLVSNVAVTHAFAGQSYNLKDLTILANESNFKEYIDHALDIRPSERSPQWAKMTRKMSYLYIENKRKHRQYDEESYRRVESLYEIPVLRSDERFTQKRERYAVEYLSRCFEKRESTKCIQRLDVFWNEISKSINQSDIGVELARIVKKKFPQKNIWKYLSPATTGQLSEFHCKRAEVRSELFKKVSLELRKLPINKVLRLKLNSIANDKCWNLILPELGTALLSSTPSASFSAYRVLNLKGKLSELDRTTYLFSYILNGPIVGETFNEAWKAIEALGVNYKLRRRVLVKIMSQDYIQDELFNTPDKKTRDVLIDLINKNVPEFLDQYARTCLDYLEGKKSFPRGNPTKHCRTFFKFSKKKPWPAHGLKSRYKSLPKY